MLGDNFDNFIERSDTRGHCEYAQETGRWRLMDKQHCGRLEVWETLAGFSVHYAQYERDFFTFHGPFVEVSRKPGEPHQKRQAAIIEAQERYEKHQAWLQEELEKQRQREYAQEAAQDMVLSDRELELWDDQDDQEQELEAVQEQEQELEVEDCRTQDQGRGLSIGL
jgi:hypothetical protein